MKAVDPTGCHWIHTLTRAQELVKSRKLPEFLASRATRIARNTHFCASILTWRGFWRRNVPEIFRLVSKENAIAPMAEVGRFFDALIENRSKLGTALELGGVFPLFLSVPIADELVGPAVGRLSGFGGNQSLERFSAPGRRAYDGRSSSPGPRLMESSAADRPRPSSLVPVYKLILLATGSAALVVLLAIAGLLRAGDRALTTLTAFLQPTRAEPRVELPTLVVERVRSASELTTAVFAMEAVVPVQQDRRLGNLTLGSTRLLYVAHGEVRAGVDLSALDTADVEVGAETVVVRLPPPRILDRKIDVEKSRVYDYNRGWLGLGPDVGPQLQSRAARTTLQRIVTTACDRGILEDANQRAELAVEELLNLPAGAPRVEIATTPPRACG